MRRRIVLSVGGMTCGSCASRVERHLNGLPGVEARVNYATERASVDVPEDGDPDVLIAAVRDLGYSADLAADLVQPTPASAAGRLSDPPLDRSVRTLRHRLVLAAVLFMPLCDLSIVLSVLPQARFPGWRWVLVVLAAPVVAWAAWPFHESSVRHALRRTATMDTLVSLGVVASTAWSVATMFFVRGDPSGTGPSLLAFRSGGSVYLDVAAGVTTFLLAGRYYEARSRQRSGDALRTLAALGSRDVSVVRDDGHEVRLPVSDLAPGDRFVVRPGEKVATDGIVEVGRSAFDRSAMTGESQPASAGPGDEVTGGTLCLTGRLIVRAAKVGADTQLGQMLALVERAQNEKADVQRAADRVASVFVPAVIALAAVTLAGWLAIGGGPDAALNASLSVLVVACPCALGLATPTAMFVASGVAARQGIFFKGYPALETSRAVDTVVFDKTGTITEGDMTVVGVAPVSGSSAAEVLALAASVDAASQHPVARAIVSAVPPADLLPVQSFAAEHGVGASGVVGGHRVSVVGRTQRGADFPDELEEQTLAWASSGRSIAVVCREDVVIGTIAVADTLRPSACEAVDQLHRLGLRTVLLSGDIEPAVRAVAAAVGIDDVVATASPSDKVARLRAIEAAGHSVAMVGDGVNDAPALATAALGIAVRSGTGAALDAADVIIARNDLTAVPEAVLLARRTVRIIRSNLWWAFGYNVAAIPLAAAGMLDPLIAGGAMALSSALVVWNSSRIRHVPGRVPRTSRAMRRHERASPAASRRAGGVATIAAAAAEARRSVTAAP